MGGGGCSHAVFTYFFSSFCCFLERLRLERALSYVYSFPVYLLSRFVFTCASSHYTTQITLPKHPSVSAVTSSLSPSHKLTTFFSFCSSTPTTPCLIDCCCVSISFFASLLFRLAFPLVEVSGVPLHLVPLRLPSFHFFFFAAVRSRSQ